MRAGYGLVSPRVSPSVPGASRSADEHWVSGVVPKRGGDVVPPIGDDTPIFQGTEVEAGAHSRSPQPSPSTPFPTRPFALSGTARLCADCGRSDEQVEVNRSIRHKRWLCLRCFLRLGGAA
jgi:hypothetical protein